MRDALTAGLVPSLDTLPQWDRLLLRVEELPYAEQRKRYEHEIARIAARQALDTTPFPPAPASAGSGGAGDAWVEYLESLSKLNLGVWSTGDGSRVPAHEAGDVDESMGVAPPSPAVLVRSSSADLQPAGFTGGAALSTPTPSVGHKRLRPSHWGSAGDEEDVGAAAMAAEPSMAASTLLASGFKATPAGTDEAVAWLPAAAQPPGQARGFRGFSVDGSSLTASRRTTPVKSLSVVDTTPPVFEREEEEEVRP